MSGGDDIMSKRIDQLLEDFKLGVITENDLDRCNQIELQEFYDRLKEVSYDKEQSMYNLSPYDEDDEYYVDRSWLNKDDHLNIANLTRYNIYNTNVFTSLLRCYMDANGSFPDVADWPQYLDARRSIARGDDQSTIYKNLLACFGNKLVKQVVPHYDVFIDGLVLIRYKTVKIPFDDKYEGYMNDEEMRKLYYLIKYDEENYTYDLQSWLREELTDEGRKNLKRFNVTNTSVFNAILYEYWHKYGGYKPFAMWPQYLKARNAIAAGKSQLEIYDCLLDCFGIETISRFIPNKQSFISDGSVYLNGLRKEDYTVVRNWRTTNVIQLS